MFDIEDKSKFFRINEDLVINTEFIISFDRKEIKMADYVAAFPSSQSTKWGDLQANTIKINEDIYNKLCGLLVV